MGDKNQSQIYIELNCLRGVSALLVVLFHYTTHYEHIFGHLANWPINIPFGGDMIIVFLFLLDFLGLNQ